MNELNGLKLGGAVADDPRRVIAELQTKTTTRCIN